MGVEDHTDYEGGGVMPNTVHPKGSEALTPSDKLRLDAITGQNEDSRAPVDPYHWNGGIGGDDITERQDRFARQQRERRARQSERNRYRESRP